jgi:hypothetical protein
LLKTNRQRIIEISLRRQPRLDEVMARNSLQGIENALVERAKLPQFIHHALAHGVRIETDLPRQTPRGSLRDIRLHRVTRLAERLHQIRSRLPPARQRNRGFRQGGSISVLSGAHRPMHKTLWRFAARTHTHPRVSKRAAH